MTEQEFIDPTVTPPGQPPFEALPPHGHVEPPLTETATEWIEQNQTTAILAAFAAGVFLGVLMRR